MNAAERLRNEMLNEFPFKKSEFVDFVSDHIKKYGKCLIYCAPHIRSNKLECMPSLEQQHERAAITILEGEGFRVDYDYNGYGVKRLRVEL